MLKTKEMENGITLIALVVTIIVLLILAGVTISITVGGEGLFSKSKSAREAHIIAEEKEALELVKPDRKIASYLEEVPEDQSEKIAEILANYGKQAKVTQDEEDHDNYVVLFNKTNHIYYLNLKTGEVKSIGTYDDEANEIELQEADIKFKYTPSSWTNGKVVTTIAVGKIEEKENYVIQWSKDNKNFSVYTEGIESEKNEKIYARIRNNQTGQLKASAVGNVENIDTKKPEITNVSATSNSITLRAKDERDEAKGESYSGVIGYAVTESNTEPSNYTMYTANPTNNRGRETIEETVTKTIDDQNIVQSKTYYVWIKDEAGNVSTSTSTGTQTVTELQQGDIEFTYTPSTWTNLQSPNPDHVQVTASIKNASLNTAGYTLYVGTSLADCTHEASAGVPIKTNGKIYAVLKDSSGQAGVSAAVGNVENIDTKKPDITSASATTNSITIQASDTAGTNEKASGIIGYAVTTTNSMPSSFTGCTNTTSLNTTVTKTIDNQNIAQNTTYYTWVKDEAGNISNAKDVKTKIAIYKITLDNQSATSSGTTAIYEKHSYGYYIDSACTTQMTTTANGITIPSRTGYIFKGYYTATNGGGTQYIDASGKLTNNANITNFTDSGRLYAKWILENERFIPSNYNVNYMEPEYSKTAIFDNNPSSYIGPRKGDKSVTVLFNNENDFTITSSSMRLYCSYIYGTTKNYTVTFTGSNDNSRWSNVAPSQTVSMSTSGTWGNSYKDFNFSISSPVKYAYYKITISQGSSLHTHDRCILGIAEVYLNGHY